MNVIRFILHSIRKGLYRILGIKPMVETFMPYVDERLERMVDRICLLESQVNWRMHGLPPAFANVKLEQLGSLLDHNEIKNLLHKVHHLQDGSAQMQWFNHTVFSQDSLLVGFPNILTVSNQRLTHARILCDPEDILSVLWFKELPKHGRYVHTDVLTFLLSLEDGTCDVIWLGDVLTRVSPLKGLLVLKHAYRVVRKGGRICGLQHSQNIASQLDYSFNWECLEAIDIPKLALSQHQETYEIKKN